MGIRTVLFFVLFLFCAGGALGVPLLGVLGYVAHYVIGPERQWWYMPLRPLEIRYSLVLAVAAAIGIAMDYQKLRFGATLLSSQEKALLWFVGLLWLLRELSEPTEFFYTVADHPAVKLAKVALFCLMLTHVVTDLKSLRLLVWTLVVSTLFLGLQAYAAPRSAFSFGRLERIGGVDFSEANFLPAFLGAMLPLMGVLFLQSRWLGKLVAAASAAFSVNAIILTRSRGGVAGIAIGTVIAVVFAPKGYRAKIFAGLAAAALGGLYLADTAFLARTSTLSRGTEELDLSARSRLETWALSIHMFGDHLLGVGPGNFFQFAGRYNPWYEGRDAHNTYVRCFTELGIPGFLLFLWLIFNAVRLTRRTIRRAYALPADQQSEVVLLAYGFAVGLCIMIGVGLTVTLLYTEALWWLLLMPVCLERVVNNLAAEQACRFRAAVELDGTAECPTPVDDHRPILARVPKDGGY